jgi:hypothetical protein
MRKGGSEEPHAALNAQSRPAPSASRILAGFLNLVGLGRLPQRDRCALFVSDPPVNRWPSAMNLRGTFMGRRLARFSLSS